MDDAKVTEAQTIEELKRVCDRYRQALLTIYNMPQDSVWDDDRDDCADLMVDAAREALFPTPTRRKAR
jgi:hypothetical protein